MDKKKRVSSFKGTTSKTGDKVKRDSGIRRSPRIASSSSLDSEPSQSPQSGVPPRKRSRAEFEEDTKSSFNLGESTEDNVSCSRCQEKERELSRLVEELSIRDKIKEEFEEMKAKYEEERRQKEEALSRLSALASSKLRENNPNIADLSDQNRPTKIAEKMSELYDNQWTDAFDALQNKMSETETIQFLLDILMRSYKACQEISSGNYLEKVQRVIEFPAQGEPSVTSQCVLPNELKQQIIEFRKSRAMNVMEDVQKAVQEKFQPKYSNVEGVKTYISSCAEICWLMVVQTPPLVLSDTTPPKFDTNMFKDYTKRGKYVEYMVWPALFLQEGGALLSKGVAQGCSNRS